MNRVLKICFLLLFAPAVLLGQGWPLPAKTPDTEVPCSPCPNYSQTFLKTIGYSQPITTFTGRFLDSQATGDYQQTFRTARAKSVLIAPERNRIYMMLGGAVAAYNINTFFTRLASNEPLWPSTAVPVHPANRRQFGTPEVFLQWDKYFYAENGSPWKTIFVDGQERLFGIDYDDQGYVYLAYSIFGWGIVKDDGGTGGGMMDSVYQNIDTAPGAVASLKTSNGRYLLLVYGASTEIWDVTNRSNPSLIGKAPFALSGYAKSANSDRIAVIEGNGLKIYSADTLASGSLQPVQTISSGAGGGGYYHLASDGQNFFAYGPSGTGTAIYVIKKTGESSYTQSSYTFGFGMFPNPAFSLGFQYGSGFLTIAGASTTSGWDLQLLKVDSNLVPSVVDTKSYFRRYYSISPDATHATPFYSNITDSVVYKSGSKFYMFVCDFGLGDVYELKGADSLSTSFKGTAGTRSTDPAVVAVAPPTSGPFYGDKLKFQADATTTSPVTTVWNFGNQEAASGADPNIVSGIASGTPVVHQYSGMTPSTCCSARTVTATNANDATMTSSVNIQLLQPVARFGVRNTSLLFKQPDASSPAPIIVGDQFFDASDGDVEGHWVGWNIDSSLTKTIPWSASNSSYLVDVGTCGSHSLLFDDHYGPYSGSASSLATIGPDFLVGIHPFNYMVRPFASAVNGPTSSGDNVLFTSGARVTTNTLLMPSTQLTYKWDLVTNAGLQETVLVSGPAATSWSLPKTTIQQFPGSRVRLVVTSQSPTGACLGMNSSTAYSKALNPPPNDLAISGGCTSGGPPCTYSVASPTTQPDADGWTYSWSVSGPGAASPATSSTATYAPTFSAVGSYTISVTVANGVGSKTVTKPEQVTAISTCNTMSPTSVFINVSGPNSGCIGGSSSVCSLNEAIAFSMTTFGGYDFSCGHHTFQWTFGDGSALGTGGGVNGTITHPYSSAGTYNVSCAISNGVQNFTANYTVVVGGAAPPPPPPPPPPPTGCGTMIPNGNVFVSYQNNSGSCSALGGSCNTGEAVNFSAQAFGYSFTCANHTFSWNFGDGHTATGQTATNSFSSPGTYSVKVTIYNGSQSVDVVQNVAVQGAGNPPPPPPPTGCGTMVPNSNVFINYQNNSGSCSALGGSCNTGEVVNFSVQAFGYSFTCANHTFSWNFGDGHTATGQAATNTFNSPGTYSVKVTIYNGSQSVDVVQNVSVQGAGNPPPPPPPTGCGTMVPNSNVFVNYQNASGSCTAAGGTCVALESITFTAASFGYSFACATHTFSWDFGDGHTASGQSAHNTFNSAGTYNVQLTINNGSQSVTVKQPVSIAQNSGGTPGTTFSFTVAPWTVGGISIPNGYVFTASSNPPGAITTWNWDFGDGPCSQNCTGASVTHIYKDNGNYTVTLSVPGQPNSVSQPIFVRHRPSGHH